MMRRAFVIGLLLPPWSLFMLCCYWYFIDNEVPMVFSRVMVLDGAGAPVNSVKRGHSVVIGREVCATDEGKANFTRLLALQPDRKLIYFLPSTQDRIQKGCRRSFREVHIPSFVEPGRYEYVVTMVFENNPLVDTRMVLPIPSFEVLP